MDSPVWRHRNEWWAGQQDLGSMNKVAYPAAHDIIVVSSIYGQRLLNVFGAISAVRADWHRFVLQCKIEIFSLGV